MLDLTVLVAANYAFHRFMKRQSRTAEVLRRNEEFARSNVVDALPMHIAILGEGGTDSGRQPHLVGILQREARLPRADR